MHSSSIAAAHYEEEGRAIFPTRARTSVEDERWAHVQGQFDL